MNRLDQAVAHLRAGGLVVMPTDTVYGLACDPLCPEAVRRVFEAKGRREDKPLAMLVASIGQAKDLVAAWPDAADRITQAFWPGALTIVLPKAEWVSEEAVAGQTTVGVRMPDHPVALELIRRFGRAVAATSANRSGETPATDVEQSKAALEGVPGLVFVDGGTCRVGMASTVVDLPVATGGMPRVLREGSVSAAQLRAVLGDESR